MTGALLVAIYVAALGCFLGLDILARVPATLHAAVLAALGALAGVGLIGAMALFGGSPLAAAGSPALRALGLILAGAAVGGGLLAASKGAAVYRARKNASGS